MARLMYDYVDFVDSFTGVYGAVHGVLCGCSDLDRQARTKDSYHRQIAEAAWAAHAALREARLEQLNRSTAEMVTSSAEGRRPRRSPEREPPP